MQAPLSNRHFLTLALVGAITGPPRAERQIENMMPLEIFVATEAIKRKYMRHQYERKLECNANSTPPIAD